MPTGLVKQQKFDIFFFTQKMKNDTFVIEYMYDDLYIIIDKFAEDKHLQNREKVNNSWILAFNIESNAFESKKYEEVIVKEQNKYL